MLTYVPEDPRHIYGNRHGWGTRILSPEAGEQPLTRLEMIYPPPRTFCLAHSDALVLRVSRTFLQSFTFDLEAGREDEWTTPSRLSDLNEVRQRISDGPRSHVSGDLTE